MSDAARLNDAHRLEQSLDGLVRTEDLRLNGAGRFPRYLSIIRDYDQQHTDQDRGAALLEVATAQAEVGELADAIEMLLRPPRIERWIHLLQQALGGPVLPDGKPDSSRSAQFELWTAACCRAAGGLPVFAEPDLRVRVGGRLVAVAAKRISSAAKLDQRVSDAREQIELSTTDDEIGVVAMDLTPALGLHSRVATVAGAVALTPERDRHHRQISVLGRRIDQRASKCRRVRAATAYARWTALMKDEQRLITARHWIAGPIPAFAETEESLKQFLVSWANIRR